MSVSHTVAEADDDIRLDRWFKRHYPGFPHALLEKQLRKGQVRIDGKKAKSSDHIRVGQIVECPDIAIEERVKKRNATADDLAEVKKWVVYKDDRIIVINKPFGLAVQGGSKVEKSLDDVLDGLMFDKKERPRLVHRLDRDTTGCLMLARSAKVASALMPMFAGRSIDKTYIALVNNLPDPLRGTVDLPLLKKENPLRASSGGHGPQGRDYEIVKVDAEGQKAITEYRVIDQLVRQFALVELKPLTGRMHQLRVHMQAIGCPILGDHKYGGGNDAAQAVGVENQLHLHAFRLNVPAFAGGPAVQAMAPVPGHMRNSFKALGIDIPKR